MRVDLFNARVKEGGKPAFTLAEVVIAIAIVAVVFGGLITAYIQSARRAEWTGYSLAAQALAVQQLEVARSAVWSPPVRNELMSLPLLGSNWNATTRTYSGYTTNILDIPISGTNYVRATNYITIRIIDHNGATIPDVDIQMVKVQTVWPFAKGKATKYFTNTVSSYFAPDNRDPQTLY